MEIKKHKRLIIVFLITIFSIFLLIKADRSCYHYGLGSYIDNNILPYGLQPVFKSNVPDEIVLENQSAYNYFVTDSSKNLTYTDDDVNNLISYYYNDSSIIVRKYRYTGNNYNEKINEIFILSKVDSLINIDGETSFEFIWKEISGYELGKIENKYKYVYLAISAVGSKSDFRFELIIISLCGIIYSIILLIRILKIK